MGYWLLGLGVALQSLVALEGIRGGSGEEEQRAHGRKWSKSAEID